MKSGLFAGLSFAALAASHSAAFAQDTNAEDIVVTAQKREEKLREVPISISAVTSDQLVSQGASRFTDYAGYIPGMSFSASSIAGQGEINLRGVTTALSPTASTAIYIDEVPTTTHGTWGGSGYKPIDLFPYDLERVEVLRGPQGTLYGDSTIGGLVKYVTRTADVDDFSGAAGVEAIAVTGGHGLGGGGRAMINVPIAPGVLGVRVSGFYQKNPGFITNVTTGRKGTNETEQRGLRVAARLAPNDDFSIDAQWLHSEFDGDGRTNIRLVPGSTEPLYGTDKYDFRLPEPTRQTFDLLSATARYDFGPVNLTSVTGWSRNRNVFNSDASSLMQGWISMLTGGAVTNGLGRGEGPTVNRKFSQEVRLASAQDQRLTWQIGGYYSVEDTDTVQSYIPYRTDGSVYSELLEIYRDEVQSRYTDISAFANATFKVTDKWEVSGGIRHSRITDDFHERAVGSMLSGSQTIPYFDDIKAKYKATTWSLTTRYIADDDLMMFARAASGFRAGGINYTWPGAQKSYDPDSLVSYEAGVRADFLDDKASIDLTVYYLDWKDFFILAFTPDAFEFGYQINGGKANGLGMEFTGTLRPAQGLSLTATAAYYGLKVRQDLPTIGAEAGDRTPTSPAWSGSLLADYRVPLSGDWTLNLGGGVRWTTHTYSRFIGDPQALRLDGYAVVDLNAAVSSDRWTLRGYVRNLANDRTFISAAGQNRGVQMNPRTMGLAIDMRF
ncbi:TonB-dependent receptor [Sphingomonas colocasiae]|uniref:TonB-dependent receptor n=1 Tax=Sphingomonas colocasiae TaxID=1848973 RepID=A0ABS7PXY9_9SPHN|nr:TonB-dependent receptor [Sphingomonas colocasiae]MBY8826226.1 TonB-dependent receptor [Sphingomonas colocasiae]